MMQATLYQGKKIQIAKRDDNEYRGFIDEIGAACGRTEAEAFDKCVEIIDAQEIEDRLFEMRIWAD
jgi:hypothetical protein